MERVLVLVEGPTEERFIKDVLAPHLLGLDVAITPSIITTKFVKRGPNFKGGARDFGKIHSDLRRLLGDSGAAAITTMFDYYGLPENFPGMDTLPAGQAIDRIRHVETAFATTIAHRKFRPFLMSHEFEAFLFAAPVELCTVLHRRDILPDVEKIRGQFSSPEEINENPETAPSKRVTRLFPGYQKPWHGPLVTKRTGLPTLHRECPHFGEWLSWLESLGKA